MLTRLFVFLLVLPLPLQAEEFTGKVVGISDGDTIRVLHDQKEVKIRLFGIDAPESKQAFGSKAKQKTSELAFGKTVTVKVHDTDRYGRTVAEIILPDGKSLNRELVREGCAWWYHHYSKDATLGTLEAEARKAKKGLWAEPNPTEPWEFRKGNRDEEHASVPPAQVVPGGIMIIGLLPDPKGRDEGNEQVVIGNTTDQAVDLKGWEVQDAAGHTYGLSGSVSAKGKLTITMTASTMSLNNNGDEISLLDGKGVARSRVKYAKDQVKAGQMIGFGR